MAGNTKAAAQKIRAAIRIHTGHMKSSAPPSKESERREMKLLRGALQKLKGR